MEVTNKLTKEEFSVLISRHGNEIFSFCFYLTGNRTDAEDLYQEAFLKALERIHMINREQNPKALLLALAAGLWKNHRRKAAWRMRIAPMKHFDGEISSPEKMGGSPTPEDIAILHEQSDLLRKAACSLKECYKVPLLMHYTAELSVEEIAIALHIPKGTVKSRLHHARKKIKQAMEVDAHEGRNLDSLVEARFGAD
ncbi:ECF RNA polymerase sigma factor SigW [compost metagenome]